MQEVSSTTRQNEIEIAAFEGAQIGGLDSAAGAADDDAHHSTAAQTPLATRTHTSDGSSPTSDVDEKSEAHASSPPSDISKPTSTPEKAAKQGSGHWLQQDQHVIPYNNMKIVMPGICLIIGLAALDQTIGKSQALSRR